MEVKRYNSNKTHDKIKFTFAASSTLANQITRGAPSDIIISANKAWIRYLERNSAIDDTSKKTILLNRLVVAAHRNTWQASDVLTKTALKKMVKNSRLSIGNPTHVPAGIYGKQALQSLGLWSSVSGRLAPAGNVRGALAMVERNETSVGVLYRTDALSRKKVSIIYVFPERTHDPIEYVAAIVRGKQRPAVKEFYDMITGPNILGIFTRFGFDLP